MDTTWQTHDAVVNILLNVSLLGAVMLAPGMMVLANWYRSLLPNTLMVWKKPELVILTVLYAIGVLVLIIVGVSCLSYYIEYPARPQPQPWPRDLMLRVAILSGLLLVMISGIYFSLRKVLVQVVSSKGIVLNDRLVRLPDYRNTLPWSAIADYYVTPDYPNAIYTLLVRGHNLRMQRISLRVPLYLQDKFEDLLEAGLTEGEEAEANINRRWLSEN